MQTLAIGAAEDPTLPLSLSLDISLDDTIEPTTVRRRAPALFEATGATHPGKVRTNNEDAYVIYPDIGLCAVADGLGGRRAGDVASAMTLHEARQFLTGAPVHTALAAAQSLGRAIEHANQAVRRAAEVDPRCKGMASTFAGVLFCGRHVAIAHAGDSRVYRVRRGKARRLTVDHSLRELYLQTYGTRADPQVAERNASIVTRAVGGKPDIRPDIHVETLEPGDAFLLCTDGLWGLVDDEEIAFAFAAAPTLDAVVAGLMATAYNRGGPDNITTVVARPLVETCSRS